MLVKDTVGHKLVKNYIHCSGNTEKRYPGGLEGFLRDRYEYEYLTYAKMFGEPLTFSKWLQLPIKHVIQ